MKAKVKKVIQTVYLDEDVVKNIKKESKKTGLKSHFLRVRAINKEYKTKRF